MVLLVCRDVVGVFYSPSRLDLKILGKFLKDGLYKALIKSK